MRDEPSIMRQWLLLRAFIARRHGMSVREMASEMCVAEKTIRRDLQLLRRLGFPFVETNGERGRKTWQLANDGKLPPLSFSYDEAVALYLSRRFL
jgi:predicted DNA-binding transcriptional regulator YafY